MAETFIKGLDDYQLDSNKLNFYGVMALRDAIVGRAVEDYVDYTVKSKKIASIFRNPFTTYDGDAKNELRYKGNMCLKRLKETRQFFDSDYFQNLTLGAVDVDLLNAELDRRINEIDIDEMPFRMKGVHVPKEKK